MPRKILISWSSGKDSAWMLHRMRESGEYEIGALLTTVNEAVDRVAMHAVRVKLLESQACAAGVPLWMVPIPASCPNEIYEKRLGDAVRRAVAEGFTHVAFWRFVSRRCSPVSRIAAGRIWTDARLPPVGSTNRCARA